MILTVALCFFAALFEGLDIVATGIVGPQLSEVFSLTPQQFGRLSSSSTFGLLIGAIVGGWTADRIGRRKVLIVSMFVFGLMTLLATQATSHTLLFAIRFVTGLGLGGAMPNLIALCAESSQARLRTTVVTLMFSGVPLGAALGAAIALWGGANQDWRILFYWGGIGPLVLGALAALWLPESPMFRLAKAGNARLAAARPDSAGRGIFGTLFGGGRAAATAYLWIAFFCTLIAIYLLVSWLPLLLVGEGLSRPQAAIALMVFNVAGAVGAIILGSSMDRFSGKAVLIATYAGMIAALFFLLQALRVEDVTTLLLAVSSSAAGFFIIGAQIVLYGMAPRYYSTPVRATGVGASVAAGRVGSVVGPIIAGQMLGAGATAAGVVTALVPFAIVAGVSAFLLVLRPIAIE